MPGAPGFAGPGALAKGEVVAPASTFAPEGGAEGMGGLGGPGALASRTVGAMRGAAPCEAGRAPPGVGGAPAGRTGGAREGVTAGRGVGAGATGSATCVVETRAAGGGKGALGNWIGAVDLLAIAPTVPMGEVGTRAVLAPAGVTEVVMGRGTGVAP